MATTATPLPVETEHARRAGRKSPHAGGQGHAARWGNCFHQHHLTFQNYHDALTQAKLGEAFVNSLAITLPATLIPIMVAAFSAYAFAFMRFPGRDTLFILIVSLLVVPNYVAFVPLLKLYGVFHMVGTFPAVWLAHIGFGMS